MNLQLAKEERMKMEKVQVRFAATREGVIIPSKRDEDAGLDIYACFDKDFIVIEPHTTEMIPTGLASAVEAGWYFQLAERGSTGSKGMGQRCGVIDSGYRNEWFVPITNHNNKPIAIVKDFAQEYMELEGYTIYPYEKAICQAILLPVPLMNVEELSYDELLEIKSERGLGALGSSGK